MRAHVEYHVNASGPRVPSMYCGMCGVNQMVQYTRETNVSGCITYLETGAAGKLYSKSKHATFRPVVKCLCHGKVSFKLSTAQKSTGRDPSTNRLVRCEACPNREVPTVYWTWPGVEADKPKGLAYHYAEKHPALAVPECAAMTKAEVEAVRKAFRYPKRGGKGKAKAKAKPGRSSSGASAFARADGDDEWRAD